MKSGYNLYLGRSVPENNLIHTTWVFNWGGWWSRHQDFQMQVRRNSPRHLVLWGSSVVWCFLQVHPCTCVTCLSEWSDAQSTMDQSLKRSPNKDIKKLFTGLKCFFDRLSFTIKPSWPCLTYKWLECWLSFLGMHLSQRWATCDEVTLSGI